MPKVPRGALTTNAKGGMRAAVSIVIAAALVVPALPLSQIAPAYAETVDGVSQPSSVETSPEGPSSEISASHPEQIYAQLALDGSTVDVYGNVTSGSDDLSLTEDMNLANLPKTDEEKQAILDGYLADGTITEEDLNDEFVVDSLTGAYMEGEQGDPADRCANEQDGFEDAMREDEERQQEANRLAAEAQAVATFTEADVEAAQREAREAEEASMTYDPTLTSEDVLVSQPGEYGPFLYSASSGGATAFAASRAVSSYDAQGFQAQNGPYSTDVVLKDIKSVILYDNSGTPQTQDIFVSYINNYLDRHTAYVQMINMPSFYSPVLSASLRDGCIYVTLQLPAAAGEEKKTFEVLYTKGADWEGYVKTLSGQPVANDATMMANIASTPGYDASRDQAYRNAYKLAPYASYEDIVRSGNAIPTTSGLYSKTIQELWPVHVTQGMKVSMLEGEEEDIVRNVVYFSDGTSETSDLQFLGTKSLTASYTMGEAGILYQPDFWTLGEGAKPGIDRMAAFIRSKTYNNYFAPFKSDVKMHRTVRDYFDRNIHDKAEEVAANLLTNIPVWNPTYSESKLWNYYMSQAENAKPTDNWQSHAVELKMFNLLFLYTYWDRFLNFGIGGSEETGFQNNANAFLVMAFRGGVVKPGLSLVNMTYDVRSDTMLSYSMIRLMSNTVINTRLGPFTGIYNSPALIQTLVKRTSGYADVANWFADYMSTIAFYHEYEPPVIEGHPETAELYWRGWDQASRRYPDYLPIWLTMEPGAMYMGSTSMLFACGSTYIYNAPANFEFDDAQRAAFKARLDNIFPYAAKYSSTVATIVGKERVNTTIVLTLDNMTSRYDYGTAQNVYYESHGLWGKHYTEDPWHKHFYDVSELYDTTGGQGAAAATYNMSPTNKRILFLAYTSLSCGWSYYWSHEMAHALDNDVFLGAGRRDGGSNEDFTDGLLTQGHGALTPVINLCYEYNTSSDIMSNYDRDRIYGKDQTDDFYGKMYETLDMLDYAALLAFLRLDKDEQNAVASQVWFSGQNGNSPLDSGTNTTILCSRSKVIDGYDGTVSTMPVNASVFNDGSKKFETIEEVYDNQLFLRGGIADGSSITWQRQIYVTEDNRGTWWFPVHANTFYPDSRSFKVMMYRMLGREGYDAFATYGSAGGNDLQKLKQITGCSSYKEWQMQTWSGIEAKKDNLAYADFDDLVDKFEVALRSDASMHDRNLGSMSSLRTRMFYMMKRVTNDFRYGIYENQKPVTHINTLGDLLKVADNPQGNYVLDSDIDASSAQFEAGGALLGGVFYGKFDGQGHKIYVKGSPIGGLFEGARHAYVKNLTLEGITSDTMALTAVNCELENIAYTRFERQVWSVDDFVGINNDLRLGVNKFHLMADLDLSEWSAANAADEAKKLSVVTQFMGGTQMDPKVFNGNGHTITGLSGASLFDKACYAEMRDFTLKSSSNMQDAAAGDNVALIARRSAKSVFEDLYLDTVSAQGRYRVGFIVGDDGGINASGADRRIGGSRFNRIQVTNGRLWNGNSSVQGNCCYAGFVAGRVVNSDLSDIFVQGAFASYGVSCGGVVGAITHSARLERCVSKVSMSSTVTNGKNGIVLGDIEDSSNNLYDAENTRISACFGLGNPTNGNVGRLAKMTAPAEDAFVNCYEDASITVGASLVGDAVPGVKYARTDLGLLRHLSKELQDISYTFPMLYNGAAVYENLGFDADVWEFDPTIEIGYPMLRFVGNRASFAQYDLDIAIDYKNEKLVCSGTDFDASKMICLHNLPFRSLKDLPGSGIYKGDWQDDGFASAPIFFSVISEDPNSVDLTEIIEYEGFDNAETELKGTRSISLYFASKWSGKGYSFIKTVELSSRPKNGYADNIKGVRANSKGVGAIHVLTVGPGLMPALEYRPVPDAGAGASDSVSAANVGGSTEPDAGAGEGAGAAADAEWIPITSSSTPVVAGTYEVRVAATDSSFASYPSKVVVDPYDPDAVTYPLMLDPKGGVWAEGFDVPDTYNNEQDATLPVADNIARRGYTFAGWYDNEALSGSPRTEIPAGQTEALTFYAAWTPNVYSVTLDLDGGRIVQGSNVTSYTFGEGSQLPVPAKDNYEFGGWYDSASFEGDPVDAIGVDAVGDKHFVAKWYRPVFNVTLEPGEGAFVEGVDSTFTYEGGAGAALPDASQMVWEGHTFAGWFEDSAFSGLPVTSIPPEARGDKRYFAKWDLGIYSITFSPNGGTLGFEQTGVSSYTYGTPVTLPLYERPGYEFLGWFDNAELAGSAITEVAAGQSGDKHYYAKWEPKNYAISYNLGVDGAGATPPDTIDLSAYESYRTSDAAFRLPGADVMAWEGHTFAGWHAVADLSDAPMAELAAGTYGDKSLYAAWVGEACVLSFHQAGGAFVSQPKTVYEFGADGVAEGDEVDLPGANDIVRSGYAFDGWYADEACSGSPVEKVRLVKGAIDLYAKWTLQQYSIAFELNGGAFSDGFVPPSSYTVETGEIGLPSSGDLVRDGFVFKGWYEDEGFADAPVASIPAGSVGGKAFYAKWEEEQVTPPGPDEPDPDNPGPLPPNIVIVSLDFGTGMQQTVSWAEVEEDHFYGRIEVLRSNMPTKPEDFSLAVPNGVVIRSITKRTQAITLAHPLEAFVSALSSDDAYGVAAARDAAAAYAAPREGSQSDFWDILLGYTADPDLHKLYTLEVVPVEEGKPTPIPTPDPDPIPNPSPDPGSNPGPSPVPSTPYVPTANNGLGSDAGLADTGDGAMGGALALGLLGACFGVLSLVVGLIARSRRA